MNIIVEGTGYVSMSVATLFAQHNHVIAADDIIIQPILLWIM